MNSIEWNAPIVPGVSMAAIPLHAAYDDLDTVIAAYLIDADARLYRFEGGPDLRLERYGPDEHGNGGLLFSLRDGECDGYMDALDQGRGCAGDQGLCTGDVGGCRCT